MALNRHLALVSRKEYVSPKVPAGTWIVADINGRTARAASRHVYAPSDDFTLLGPGGFPVTSAYWYAERKAAGQGPPR